MARTLRTRHARVVSVRAHPISRFISLQSRALALEKTRASSRAFPILRNDIKNIPIQSSSLSFPFARARAFESLTPRTHLGIGDDIHRNIRRAFAHAHAAPHGKSFADARVDQASNVGARRATRGEVGGGVGGGAPNP